MSTNYIASKAALIVAICFTLVGCPAKPLLKSRDIQSVNVGYDVDQNRQNLLSDNESVDELASTVANLMRTKNFSLTHKSTSFGLLPLTGYTQDLLFKLNSNDHVRCVISISKSKFIAKFEELETVPETDIYNTNENDLDDINKAVTELNKLAHEIYPHRAVQVSSYKSGPTDDAE